jgi:predicted membrane channel-forming protein YqfA (hemolysin III family)
VTVDHRTIRGLLIAGLVVLLVSFLYSLWTRHIGGAVWSALMAGVGVWLLIRRPGPDEEERTSAHRRTTLVSAAITLGFLAFGALFAVSAAHTSDGSRRAVFIAGGTVLFLYGAWMVVTTVALIVRWPSDSDRPQTIDRTKHDDRGDT